jgi:hypothetical protein
MVLLVLSLLVLMGCSQFTTSAQEESALQSSAESLGDAYVECVKTNGISNAQQASIDAATAVTMAQNTCRPALESYKEAQNKYLSSQAMMTKKPLEEAVDALNARAVDEVGTGLLAAAPATAPVAGTATPAAAAAVGSAAAVTATQPAARPSTGWTAEQRIYLDCMEDSAVKYAGLNESAAAIAEVAHSRCSSYMDSANAALQQEGRAVAMGAVMDARLKGPPRNLPQN